MDIDFPESVRGITFYVCIGEYAGFYVVRDLGIRICLGWISLACIFCDVEATMQQVQALLKIYSTSRLTAERRNDG